MLKWKSSYSEMMWNSKNMGTYDQNRPRAPSFRREDLGHLKVCIYLLYRPHTFISSSSVVSGIIHYSNQTPLNSGKRRLSSFFFYSTCVTSFFFFFSFLSSPRHIFFLVWCHVSDLPCPLFFIFEAWLWYVFIRF